MKNTAKTHKLIYWKSLKRFSDFANLEGEAAELIYKKSTLDCFKRQRSMSRYDVCVKNQIDPDEEKVYPRILRCGWPQNSLKSFFSKRKSIIAPGILLPTWLLARPVSIVLISMISTLMQIKWEQAKRLPASDFSKTWIDRIEINESFIIFFARAVKNCGSSPLFYIKIQTQWICFTILIQQKIIWPLCPRLTTLFDTNK